MIDSNNVPLTIPNSITGDNAGQERSHPLSTVRSAPPVHANSSPRSSDALKIEKTSWQLSPEVQKVIETLTAPESTASVRLDPESNRVIVEVRNSRTGDLICEIPPEDLHRAKEEGVQIGPTLDKMI